MRTPGRGRLSRVEYVFLFSAFVSMAFIGRFSTALTALVILGGAGLCVYEAQYGRRSLMLPLVAFGLFALTRFYRRFRLASDIDRRDVRSIRIQMFVFLVSMSAWVLFKGSN